MHLECSKDAFDFSGIKREAKPREGKVVLSKLHCRHGCKSKKKGEICLFRPPELT